MEDLKAIFNTGVAFALFGVAGWLCLLLLISLIRLLFKGIGGFYRLNERLTRENPYIAAHKKMLIEQSQYNEYVNVAQKDGFAITPREEEETADSEIIDEDTPKKSKKKKKKKE